LFSTFFDTLVQQNITSTVEVKKLVSKEILTEKNSTE